MPNVDPNQLKKAKEHGIKEIAFCVARVAQSARLFYGCSDFKVYDVDMDADKLEPKPLEGDGHLSYVTGTALGLGGLVTGSYDGRLIWWNPDERRQIRAVDAHNRWIRNVVATPDGRIVASVADDMLCKLWDAESGELLHTLEDHPPQTPDNYPSMLYAVCVSPDGRYLATGDKAGHVAVWEIATTEKVGEAEAPVMYTWDPRRRRHSIGGIRSLAFTNDSKKLAVGGMGKVGNIDHLGGPSRVEIFDWQEGKRLHEIEDKDKKGLVEQLQFSPDGKWVAAAGGDHGGFVSFYDVKTGKPIHQEKAPMHVHAFAFNEAFETLYTVGHGKIVVWELKG